MVFSSKFTGDLWKTKVQLAPQEIHGDLAGDNDMFVTLAAADLFVVDLEMPGCLVDDLFCGDVLRAGMADVTD